MVSDLQNRIILDSHALAVDFVSTSANTTGAVVDIELCPNGSVVDLSNVQISYDIYYMTTSGVPFSSGTVDTFFVVNDDIVVTDPACSPDVGPDQWNTFALTCAGVPAAVTHLQLVSRFRFPWVGTIFLDNFRVTSG
jgi:hypothetical protein